MRRLLFILSLSLGYAACQCGPVDLCESTRCGPGLTCDKNTGSCVLGSTGGGLSGTGGGLASTGGGSTATGGGAATTGGGSATTGGGSATTGGGSAGGDAADAGNLSCPMTCAGNAPICDRTLGRCVACNATEGCSGATPVCNRLWQGGLGKCQVCTEDNTGCSAAAPFCDVTITPSAGCIGCRDVIVDALLGTGAKGDVVGPIREAIRIINDSGVPVISVDVPSGIDTDTGEDLGESVWATRTVTFGLPKPFLFQGLGLEHSGYWTVADIGFPLDLVETPTDARLLEPSGVCDLIPMRMRSSHKGDNGHVLVVAGSGAMPGAAVLAAKAALRSGAGLVTIASTESVCRNVAAHLPEVNEA
ncbi:MAG: hypothetical protein IAE78_23710, partial [Myxococcus sp.]|nr:hypothetical protein [Myxococcus sp.]